MRRHVVVVLFLWLGFLRTALATSQLIVNGGFEATSPNPWVLAGAGVQVVAGAGAYEGSQYLSMGNALGATEYAYQSVTLPTNLIAASLSLAYDFLSTDPNKDDYFTVYITDTDENPLINLGTASSANPTQGWDYVTTNFITYAGADELSSYAGREVNVYFYVTTDPIYGNLTSIDIDDVSLTVATTADIPANDDFTNATIIPPAGITNYVITPYASKEFGEPNIGNNGGGHSLWWT
jgi:hypothetical protein